MLSKIMNVYHMIVHIPPRFHPFFQPEGAYVVWEAASWMLNILLVGC